MPARMAVEEDKKKLYKKVVRYSTIGLEMGFSVAIGVAIGYFLDRFFKTGPWLTLIFLIFGVIAGFRSLFSLMKSVDRNERKK
ncbi:MAG: AtpZ/AtpI family protein [Deltaproteobacteria bacterium]|jgi:ATP synthase protein I|nr:AtpZ/AtpI family protein [Deltaproteobacteria bacterium]